MRGIRQSSESDGKKSIGLMCKTTTLHVHHAVSGNVSLLSLHNYNQKVPICTFCGGRDHKTKTPFFFSWTLIQSLEFNFRKSRQRLMKWSRWNQRDEVWSSANTLLKWRSVRLLLISSLFRVSKHKSVFMEEKEILLILIRQFSTVSHPEQSRRNWLAIN